MIDRSIQKGYWRRSNDRRFNNRLYSAFKSRSTHLGQERLRRKGDQRNPATGSRSFELRRQCEEIAEAHLTYKETRKRDGMRAKRTPASLRNTVPSSPGYTSFHFPSFYF